MTYDQLFQLSNTIALITWLLLLIAPYWKWTGRIVVGIVVAALCVLYAFLVGSSLQLEDLSGFGTLEGVRQLFTEPGAVLTGWVHYLAFDLMVGWYIVTNAAGHGISRWWLIPCLLLTFMLGPIGLLLYLILRMVMTGRYFQEEKLS